MRGARTPIRLPKNGRIQFAVIRAFFGLGCLFNGVELDKGIVAFHVNANEFSKGFKEGLQIFASSVVSSRCRQRCLNIKQNTRVSKVAVRGNNVSYSSMDV